MTDYPHISAGRVAIDRLNKARSKLGSYVESIDKDLTEAEREFYQEANQRIRQQARLLELLLPALSEVDNIEEARRPPLLGKGEEPDEIFWGEYTKYIEKMKSGELKSLAMKSWNIIDDPQIYTESFYYFAFRARTVIRALPGLKNFECVGVRNVRNKLIEHAERPDSGVMDISFGWGSVAGPKVKAHRSSSDKKDLWVDRGLFINSDEFSQNLEITVGRASTGGK